MKKKSPLTSEQQKLYRKAKAGDPAAISEIIQSNKGLVAKVAWHYLEPENDIGDLIQMGQIGMLRAIQKFEVNRGCKFSTYATFWIRQGIARFVGATDRTIRVPAHRIYKDKPHCDSLDAFLTSAEEGTFTSTLKAPEVDLDAPMIAAQDNELLDWALGHLDVRLARIVRLRHGIGGGTPKTLRQLARVFGVCAERIRQLERRATRELRDILKRRELGIPSKTKRFSPRRPDLWKDAPTVLVKAA